MAAEARRLLSREEYFALERRGEGKHEYAAGELVALVGASFRHNLIQTRVLASLYGQPRGRHCEVTPSDLRVAIGALGLYTYPDVTVVCGEPQFEDAEQDTLLNPTLLAEILSPSTESYDRGRKFQRYHLIPSFQEYLLIAQDLPLVEHYRRQPDDRWLLSTFEDLDGILTLDAIGCTLALADVYAPASCSTGRPTPEPVATHSAVPPLGARIDRVYDAAPGRVAGCPSVQRRTARPTSAPGGASGYAPPRPLSRARSVPRIAHCPSSVIRGSG